MGWQSVNFEQAKELIAVGATVVAADIRTVPSPYTIPGDGLINKWYWSHLITPNISHSQARNLVFAVEVDD